MKSIHRIAAMHLLTSDMKVITHLFRLPLILCSCVLLFTWGCGGNEEPVEEEIEVTSAPRSFNLGTHTLRGFSSNNRGITVIYESGLGNDGNVWGPILSEVGKHNRGVAYHRAGYSTSQAGPNPRNLQRLAAELHEVKLASAGAEKVVLVGHSWGGAIIRTYALTYPEHVHGLVFVDTSHERELILTQAEEDAIVRNYAGNTGASRESEQLIEGVEYLGTLPRLPDMPVTVITNGDSGSAWAGYHRSLGRNISASNFKQVYVTSGHDIPRNEPDVIIEAINDLLDRL